MLISMTGYGESCVESDNLSATVEVRSINNRHLKINTRVSDGIAGHETQIERLVRQYIKRGTVHISVRLQQLGDRVAYQLNEEVLNHYREQLQAFHKRHPMDGTVSLASLLVLPGVVEDTKGSGPPEETWDLVLTATKTALEKLNGMRSTEGKAMETDMCANIATISDNLDTIEVRMPAVVKAYTNRLTDRINGLLSQYDAEMGPGDVVREVGLFAERSDISEEVVRLRSHLSQFHDALDTDDGNGRRLEFVTQEMFRETNTIGSKANDAEISKHVIEIKAAIERIREMVQNVE